MNWSDIYDSINSHGFYVFIALIAFILIFIITLIIIFCCRCKKKSIENELNDPEMPVVPPLGQGLLDESNGNSQYQLYPIPQETFKQQQNKQSDSSESSLPLQNVNIGKQKNHNLNNSTTTQENHQHINNSPKKLNLTIEEFNSINIERQQPHFTITSKAIINIPKKTIDLSTSGVEEIYENSGENNQFVNISILDRMQSDMEFMMKEMEEAHAKEIKQINDTNGKNNLNLQHQIIDLQSQVKNLHKKLQQREEDFLREKEKSGERIQQAYNEGEERFKFISAQYQMKLDEMKQINQNLRKYMNKQD